MRSQSGSQAAVSVSTNTHAHLYDSTGSLRSTGSIGSDLLTALSEIRTADLPAQTQPLPPFESADSFEMEVAADARELLREYAQMAQAKRLQVRA